jgi:RNA polymerase sigma factor (sigma-70 family)
LNYQALFLEHVELLDRVVAFIARRHHLTTAECEEFRSIVRLRCIEKNYDVLRQFSGRSSLRTYLTVVVERLFLDYRVSQWGRWRPSAQARRLGSLAVQLEALIVKDGLTFDEASEVLQTNHNVKVSRKDLYELSCRLPDRTRRAFVADDVLDSMAADLVDPEREILLAEQVVAAEERCAALRRALARLAPQDRLILTMHFRDEFTIAEIARILSLDPKPLYRRIESLEKRLRLSLEDESKRPGGKATAVAQEPRVLPPAGGSDAKTRSRDVYTIRAARKMQK